MEMINKSWVEGLNFVCAVEGICLRTRSFFNCSLSLITATFKFWILHVEGFQYAIAWTLFP